MAQCFGLICVATSRLTEAQGSGADRDTGVDVICSSCVFHSVTQCYSDCDAQVSDDALYSVLDTVLKTDG